MFTLFLESLKFASEKHMAQRRKGCDMVPYINHLIKVADVLYSIGKENDQELLSAAILHDVLEDTCATEKEMRLRFGDRVTNIVIEVTDDMSLTYEDRKRHQIKNALFISADAKKIKIADKISNIEDMLTLPITWSDRRKRQYVQWSQQVIDNCRGVNVELEKAFDSVVAKALQEISDNSNN
ncbi:MAG TPA: HD domain-containing protein [Bacteroidales bacterium]|nr:HD domain-containing protein [Bacteroidales bacterium]